ncbi:MAG: nucleotide exchange factor GrpE [Candidatus Anstonellaceae archaeon]
MKTNHSTGNTEIKDEAIGQNLANEKNATNSGTPIKEETPEELSSKLSIIQEQLMRLQAEFENYKKRTDKEKENIARQAESKMMLRLLPVYEEIALAEKEASKIDSEAVRTGILMVLSKLRAAFEKEGLKDMKLEGEPFDPFMHETAFREDSDKPEGTILGVIQKGYLFRGEVLRHAIVSVSSGKSPEKKSSESHAENKK